MDSSCIELANSLERDAQGTPTEHLDDPKWIAGFIARHALPLGSISTGSRDLRAALGALRDDLRPVFERIAAAGGRVTERELQPLRAPLDAVNWRRDLTLTAEGPAFTVRPAENGIAAVIAEIAAAAGRLLTEGEPARIKICANSLCRWIFVDETKGNVRRWCRDVVCGRLDRVRRFRQKARRRTARRSTNAGRKRTGGST